MNIGLNMKYMERNEKKHHFKINKNDDDDDTTKQKIQTSTNDIKMCRAHMKIDTV